MHHSLKGIIKLRTAVCALFPAATLVAGADLVALWNFEEGSGTAAEILTTTPGSFVGTAGFVASPISPTGTDALSLPASADYFDTNLNANAIPGFRGTGAKTIITWFNTTTSTNATLFNYSPTTGATAGADIRAFVQGNGDLRVEGSAGASGVVGGTNLNDGNDHMVALVLNAGENFNDIDIYIDGTLNLNPFSASTNPAMNLGGSGSTVRIGLDHLAGRGFVGSIDDVAIYDEALSELALDALSITGVVVNVAFVDTDQDGLSDADETSLHGTDPSLRDTDGDGTPDGMEIEKGLDPNNDTEFLDRPNVLFFFVDDLGYGDVGCFWQDQKSGTQKFDTPHLDTMAAEGAKMTHHYISASVCAPSRASLLQGRHQGHSDRRDSQFDQPLPLNHTVSDMLQRAGYRTVHIGKAGLAGTEGSTSLTGNGSQNLAAHPLDRGFDEFFGYLFHADGHEHYPRNGGSDKVAHIYDGYQQITNASLDLYTTDAWTAYAKKAITEEVQDGDNQPFFLYLSYDTPHFKMQRPAVAYPSGGGLTGGIQWTTATDGTSRVRYASTADGTGVIDAYNHPDNNASWPTSNQRHVGMIRRIDNSIGDIMQLLVDLGIDDNTLVVFSSDNGPHNEGNNPRYFESFADMEGIKRDMWEAGIRVPTIVRWPNQIAGATGDEMDIHEIDYPSAIWDWMPTFAELAEVPAPAWCDGVSLVPTLTGNGTQRDKGYLYFEFSSGGNTPNWSQFPNHRNDPKGQMQCLRIGDIMGIRTSIANAQQDFELYNVVTDPGQGTNLAGSMLTMQAKMKDLALQARRPGGGVSRPYDSTHVPGVAAAVEPGIEYSSHEGIWSFVPEFRDLTATSSGDASDIDLSLRSRNDDVGMLFHGYIEVPATGNYTFHLSSDSGSNLFIHDAHVIDDDFGHDGSEQSESILLEAGLHPFRIYYRHGSGGSHTLEFSWEGPGIAKQAVPQSVLFRDGDLPPEPNALDDSASSTGSAVNIDVLSNDSDDGAPSPLQISNVGPPSFGTVTDQGGGILRYTPDPGRYGADEFSYTITDGEFYDTATVRIEVLYVGSDLWVPLNEAAGDSIHEVGGIFLGTMSGFADNDAARVQGIHGKALSLDGIDDQVFLSGLPASLLPDGSDPRTVMCWIRIPVSAPPELQVMLGYGVNNNGQRFSFRINDDSTLRLEVQGGYIYGTTPLNDGEWHHVAVVCDDFNGGGMNVNESRLYVDGVLDTIGSSGSRSINTASGTTALLGGSPHSSNYNFLGEIDELRVFSSALNQTQIQSLMNATDQEASGWHRRHFGSTAIDWSQDSDRDGLDRLSEYGLAGHPHRNDALSILPVTVFNPSTGKLESTFRRRIEGTHTLEYDLEVSSDLEDWETLTATEGTSVLLDAVEGVEEVSFSTDATIATESSQFVRLRIELTP